MIPRRAVQVASVKNRPQGRKSVAYSLPSPIGGWNARDSVAAMAPTDAITLQNWFPTTSDVMVRKGYRDWATGIPGQINTVMAYNPSSGPKQLFAANASEIYDVSAGGEFNTPLEIHRNDWEGDQLLYPTPRTNLYLQSRDLSSASWSKTRIATSVAATGPDGSSNARTLTCDAGGSGYEFQGMPWVAGQKYTVSIIAKPGASNQFNIHSFTQSGEARFTLTGSGSFVESSGAALVKGSITALVGGWYLCVATFTAAVTGSNNIAPVYLLTPGDSVTVFGPQHETGGTQTAYIATSASAVTITDYVYTPPQAIVTGQAPATGATLSVRNTNSGLTVFGTGNGTQTAFTLPPVGVFGMPEVTGLTSGQWIYTNFATSAGPFLAMVNGQDGYYVYNGTNFQQVTSSSSPISITVVDPDDLIHVNAFASRIWFIEKASLSAWYLPVGQLGGAAQQFDFSPIFRRGGHLIAMGTWTVDGGYGMQNYAAWVTSEGEIAIYGGTDPSQATTFSLVGVYQLGTPLGNRCFMKYGSDLLYIGKDGLAPMSQALSSTRVNTQVNLTAKIQGAISQATTIYGANFGWCMQLFPPENMIILNVPVALGSQQQYVMNTITGAWCNFTGWDANCWEIFDDEIYFGGNGVVGQAWFGFSDNGNNISGVAQQAFNQFGAPQQQDKRFTMMRPIIRANGQPALLANINVNYDQIIPVASLNYSPTSSGVWDSAAWDLNIWGGELQIIQGWQGTTGVGYVGSPILQIAGNGIEVHWVSTDIVMEGGAIL